MVTRHKPPPSNACYGLKGLFTVKRSRKLKRTTIADGQKVYWPVWSIRCLVNALKDNLSCSVPIKKLSPTAKITP
ncbi:hypothetical protein ACLOJK_012401 [Asimina triloba]